MCGIFGAIGSVGSAPPLTESQAIRLRDLMAARGPDGAGLLARDNVILAHRRLAIRDPRCGAQPWLNPQGSVAVVYNGEIYNDAEVRTALSRAGFTFRTRCDTELIPAAYEAWGIDCVKRFRGDFAFGLYDFDRSRMMLARDRCGAKPIFFASLDAGFVFASSIATIRRHPDYRPRPNWRVLSHYLTTLRLTLDRETAFEGIHSLLPGERLLLEHGRVEIDSYWSLPTEEPGDDFAAATHSFDTRLREATRLRLAGDVPAGLFLSGGVDSSTLGGVVQEETGVGLPAGCGIGRTANDSLPDDATFASQAASHLDCELETVEVGSDEYLETWQELLAHYETPVSTPTDVILYRLSQAMRRRAGFVLGGEGADELLCGYSVQHFAGHDLDRSRQFQSGAWSPSAHVGRLFRDSLIRTYGRLAFDSPAEHYFALNSLISSASKPALLRPRVWNSAERDAAMLTSYDRRLAPHGEESASRRTARLLHQVNLEALLSRLDSASMQASLEVRPVYTDHLLVEEAFSKPESFKIDLSEEEQAPFLSAGDLAARGSLRDKRLLRSIAARKMPGRLANRPKASFPTPIGTWLGCEWSGWASATLRSSPFAQEMLRDEALDQLADHPARAGIALWPILNVALWGDRQFAA